MIIINKYITNFKKNKLKDNKLACFAIDLTDVLISTVILIFIFYLIFSIRTVPTSSMEPTVMTKSKILLVKPPVYLKDLKKGDIVMFNATPIATEDEIDEMQSNFFENYSFKKQLDFLKRIVATGDDLLYIKNGTIYINGKKLKQNYKTVKGDTFSMKHPVKVPKGYVFVMGDNRINSDDGRYWSSDNDKVRKNKVKGYKTIGGITFLSVNNIEAKAILSFNHGFHLL